MKRSVATIILFFALFYPLRGEYNDHRGHNVDSLETAVAKWTAPMVAQASDSELQQLILDWRQLMLGYKQLNGPKSQFYARRALELAESKGWHYSVYDASKVIGEHFWAKDRYDSAAFYYEKALHAIDIMAADTDHIDENSEDPTVHSQETIDDAYSSMYGTLGNLYSMQDSTAKAMKYYGKAMDVFKEQGWFNSCAVCCCNMGETVLGTGDTKSAKRYYGEALDFAHQANDSLWIAGALKGFGNIYLTTGKTRKALKYLEEADRYYSIHEDEELFERMETLDFTSQVLKMQKRSLAWTLTAALVGLLFLLAFISVSHLLRKARKVQEETAEVLDETIEEMRPAPTVPQDAGNVPDKPSKAPGIKLNDRELSILQMLSQGRTTPQMADELCLSPETVKWYRKKLLVKFDVSTSVELVMKAKELGLLS